MLANRWIVVVLIGTALISCKSPGSDEAVEDIPEPGTFLKAEIQERIGAIEYQSKQVLVDNLLRLAYIGEPALPYLTEAMNSHASSRTRGSCAFVLGKIADRRTIPALIEATRDEVPEVRYEAATSLGLIGDRAGYRTLITGLEDSDIKNRYKAHKALQELTGLDYGYRHDDAPADRRAAILKWEAWLDQMETDRL